MPKFIKGELRIHCNHSAHSTNLLCLFFCHRSRRRKTGLAFDHVLLPPRYQYNLVPKFLRYSLNVLKFATGRALPLNAMPRADP